MNIKEKIQKIKALMEGAKTLGEAEAATLAMQRLLAKYHISMEEINIDNVCNESINEEECDSRITEKWQEYLASSLSENMRCDTFIKTYKYFNSEMKCCNYVVFIGLETDVCAVRETYLSTIKAMRKLYRNFSSKYRQENCSKLSSKERKSWYIGFVEGLDSALKKQANSNDKMSIALQKPFAVEEYMDSLTFKESRRNSKPITVDSKTYKEGFRSGETYGSKD